MMQILKIAGSEELPEVIFDKENNVFKISGRSFPEDSFGFFKPIIAWIEDYVKEPNPVTTFQVFLEYFNSSSVKQVFFLLSKLEILIKNGKEVKIIWQYQTDDELMKTKGLEFKKLLRIPFEMSEQHK